MSKSARTKRPKSNRPSGLLFGEKRTPAAIEKIKARVLAFVRKNPESNTEAVKEALKLPTSELALPMRQLVAERKLKTTGQRRGTRYSIRGRA